MLTPTTSPPDHESLPAERVCIRISSDVRFRGYFSGGRSVSFSVFVHENIIPRARLIHRMKLVCFIGIGGKDIIAFLRLHYNCHHRSNSQWFFHLSIGWFSLL